MSRTITLDAPRSQGASIRSMLDRAAAALVTTDASPVQTLVRWTLALVMLPHGAQKVFGWFGGYGIEATLGYFESLGFPVALGVLAIAAETLGPIALMLGVASRVAAAGLAGVMLGAIATVHVPYGFFMDWGGTMAGEGFEYHLLVLGMTLAILVGGGGALSLDRVLASRFRR